MRHSFSLKNISIFALVLLGTIFIIISIISRPPKDFPIGAKVHIAKNTPLSDVARSLAEKRIISSPFLFKSVSAVFYGRRGVIAGDYLFEKPQNIWRVAERLARGYQNLSPIKITIFEGTTVNDIAWILLKKIPDFNTPYFIQLAHNSEGYLFPDTYIFYPNTTPTEIFNKMRTTFDLKLAGLSSDIKISGRSPTDIVIMASILEKEATSTEDRAKISGVLWKRLDEGMLLQVDPPLIYITANPSGYVFIKDTKIDSPYNTYKYKGLPKGPIANPGLDSLSAAVHPVKTPYYFYLSDKKGNMYYAKNYAEHLVYKAKYVDK